MKDTSTVVVIVLIFVEMVFFVLVELRLALGR
jgi:hypothetical protein